MTENNKQRAKPNDPAAPHDGDHADALTKDLPVVQSRKVFIAVGVLLAVLVSLFLFGFIPEQKRKAAARAQAQRAKSAVRVVSVARPPRKTKSSDLVLPANAVGLQFTLMFPRTSGYLKELRVDIGDRVEA